MCIAHVHVSVCVFCYCRELSALLIAACVDLFELYNAQAMTFSLRQISEIVLSKTKRNVQRQRSLREDLVEMFP